MNQHEFVDLNIYARIIRALFDLPTAGYSSFINTISRHPTE